MPRVVPSQVVELIDRMFPRVNEEVEGSPFTIGREHSAGLAAVLGLVEHIPPALLVMDSSHYIEFISSLAAIREMLATWQNLEPQFFTYTIGSVAGLRRHNAVTLVRQALALCPDEIPSTRTSELKFIEDEHFRERLRLDVAAVEKALADSEWKAATVLAGSVIEALLLAVLEQHFQDNIADSVERLVTAGVFRKRNSDPKYWDLHHYIEVATEVGAVEEETAKLVRLAKDYRNLIHPGKAQRLQQECNRSTALTAIAALDRVTADLMKRFNAS